MARPSSDHHYAQTAFTKRSSYLCILDRTKSLQHVYRPFQDPSLAGKHWRAQNDTTEITAVSAVLVCVLYVDLQTCDASFFFFFFLFLFWGFMCEARECVATCCMSARNLICVLKSNTLLLLLLPAQSYFTFIVIPAQVADFGNGRSDKWQSRLYRRMNIFYRVWKKETLSF